MKVHSNFVFEYSKYSDYTLILPSYNSFCSIWGHIGYVRYECLFQLKRIIKINEYKNVYLICG